ncbi:MAG TPA: hypothetical protein VGR73_10010 [Bryobacteraceae bacterium]|nr:hypothetical protein [Bryobacteraceae bacterium]
MLAALLAFLAIFLAPECVYGQGRGGRGPEPPKSPREAAPVDLTGYWAAEVTTDWRWRMTVPPKGDYLGIALNADGRELADTWDPAKDEAAGEQCRSYGAPNIMRVPGRIHVTWQDDRTLKLETDAGQQTRIFRFGSKEGPGPQGQDNDWQGLSQASWELVPSGTGLVANQVPSGALKVATTKFKPGYLRKNGVPYSANGVLTEFFDVIKDSSGDYLIDSITFEDPMYLTAKYETAVNFKKQPDAAGWNPAPCTSR